ncbi:tunicamycin resistance protein, partial [Podochytrium sp. JEL0797]
MHNALAVSFSLALLAYYATYRFIPLVAPLFISLGRSGNDRLKKAKPVVAESMGLIAGCVYLAVMFLFIPVPFVNFFRAQRERSPQGTSGLDFFGLPTFPHETLCQYLAGLLSLFSMLFLGFVDDVVDIKWRVKIWMPLIACIPLLLVYMVTYNVTHIVVPIPFRGLFGLGNIVDLGVLYYGYMAALCIFATNAINIIAGLNGVEGIQCLVIACAILVNSFYQVSIARFETTKEAHLMAIYFLLPFVGVTVGYLRHNWFPARCFGGDTYVYFAGMTFAVVGILGRFTKTVLLFMFPQIFNFLYSCPQLFGLNEKTGNVEPTRVSLLHTKPLGQAMIRLLELLFLVDVERDAKTGRMVSCNNLTLINLLLVKFGPTTEAQAAVRVGTDKVSPAAAAKVLDGQKAQRMDSGQTHVSLYSVAGLGLSPEELAAENERIATLIESEAYGLALLDDTFKASVDEDGDILTRHWGAQCVHFMYDEDIALFDEMLLFKNENPEKTLLETLNTFADTDRADVIARILFSDINTHWDAVIEYRVLPDSEDERERILDRAYFEREMLRHHLILVREHGPEGISHLKHAKTPSGKKKKVDNDDDVGNHYVKVMASFSSLIKEAERIELRMPMTDKEKHLYSQVTKKIESSSIRASGAQKRVTAKSASVSEDVYSSLVTDATHLEQSVAVQVGNIVSAVESSVSVVEDFAINVWSIVQFALVLVPNSVQLNTQPFEIEFLDQFVGGNAKAVDASPATVQLNFFSNMQRNLMTNQVVQRCRIRRVSTRDGKMKPIGINDLLIEDVYEDYYAVHDGRPFDDA